LKEHGFFVSIKTRIIKNKADSINQINLKEKNKYSKWTLLLIVTFLVFALSCKKDDASRPINPLNGKTKAVFNQVKKYGTLTDIDANIYKTIVIGTQTWMAENLRVTRYNNGDTINEIMDNSAWISKKFGVYCNYNNTKNIDTISTYGRLYNWYAVNTNMLCPIGWHVPSDDELTTLINYLGGDTIAGAELKEIGTKHWSSPNNRTDNASGFTALPAGLRNGSGNFSSKSVYGTFSNIGNSAYWWSSTRYDPQYDFYGPDAWYRCIGYDSPKVGRINYIDNCGFSIRCIKDN
jgi:uncharacterized protein (TIGR02145 family)